MISTASQQKNDCAIVAIANATGLSYDEIQSRLPKPGKHGLSHDSFVPLIESFGFVRLQKIPRRGQEKITGIVRMISNKRVSGHLVYMKNGIVFDSFHPQGIPIKDYQSRISKCHVQMIWIRLTPTLIDTPDSEVSLDFLRSLDD